MLKLSIPILKEMTLRFFIFFIFFIFSLHADNEAEYSLGHGYTLHEALTVGAYFSTEYEISENDRSFKVDDIAFLAYGTLSENLSYLVETEAIKFYTYDLKNSSETWQRKFHIERMYADYRHSDHLGLRLGKQITPIGYWNLEPINVLRDTSSNPLYTLSLFPRFLTGVDFNGYLPNSSQTTYHLFLQKNKDLDENYINIPNEHFFGISLQHELDSEISLGGSVGEFKTNIDETFDFLQLNAKYDNYTVEIMSEVMLRNGGPDNVKKTISLGGYLQGMYRFTQKHAFVSRYEYFDDNDIIGKDQIFLMGYSYRPIFPVSLKAEYQWHEQSHQNRFLASFSVLF